MRLLSTLTLLTSLTFATGLMACAPKTASLPVLASGQTIVMAAALNSVNDPTTTEIPSRLQGAVHKQLTERQLVPSVATALPDAFATTQASDLRLTHLAKSTDKELLMLLEATPVFDAQMAGRYRWNIDVTVTLATRDDLTTARAYDWNIPVFLQFYHQQEADALAEATPAIERKMRKALDEFLSIEPSPAEVP